MFSRFGEERPLWYDKAGAPVGEARMVELRLDPGYAKVARTEIGPVLVSTVWLGLDHQWFEGPPLIFETMVFIAPQTSGFDEVDGLTRRYAAEAAALAGHEDVCELVRAMSGASAG